MNSTATKKIPTMNAEAMEMLETILMPAPANTNKTHEQLLVDETKRLALQIVRQRILVQ